MKYQFILSFLLIFLQCYIINSYLRGYSFPSLFNYKQDQVLANSFRYLYFHPRTHGSFALNTTYDVINEMINQIFNGSKYKERFQLFSYKYNPTMINSHNSFKLYTIRTDLNSSIFYFHKIDNSSDILNFPNNQNNKKIRRKNVFQNKKTIKEIYYHNNTKPLLIACRVDTNPLSPSTYDSSIHLYAILESIRQIFENREIIDNIKHDFVFVFTGCEEFNQLGAKNLMKEAFKDGGYYLFLSGFGVGRPFTLFSQSNKSSSVLQALSKVKRLPLVSFIGEVENMISLIKGKSFSMSKIKGSNNYQNDHNAKSRSRKSIDTRNLSNETDILSFLKKQGNAKEIQNYKRRFNYVNDATRFRKNKNMSGAELSFIGSPLLHSTRSDIDNDEHNLKNVYLVVDCILQFLTNFDTKAKEKEDIEKEDSLIAFGVSPFVVLIKKETLIFISQILIILFCVYLVFYVSMQTVCNYFYFDSVSKEAISKDNEKNTEKCKSIEKVTSIKCFYSILKNEFSFIFLYVFALLLTFLCHLAFVFLLSVVNPASFIVRPMFCLCLIVITIFSIFNSILYKLVHKNKGPNFNFHSDIDWHFLQVVYLTALLIAFKRFDFEVLIVVTAAVYIFFHVLPMHKYVKWLPVLSSLVILSPCVFTYVLLYQPFSLDCQDLPIFFGDVVPFIFIFIFSVHMSVFTLPLYFTLEIQRDDKKKKYHLSAFSQIYFLVKRIKFYKNIFSDHKSENQSNEKSIKSKDDVNIKTSKENVTNNKVVADDDSAEKPVNEPSNWKLIIEKFCSARKIFVLTISIFSYFIFKSPPFSLDFPIKGTFSHYFYKKSETSEISFIPKNGRRTIPFIWKTISKSSTDIKYVYNYQRRLLSDPGPAFVKSFSNSTLPFFFTHWPIFLSSSIQNDGSLDKYSSSEDENEDKSDENYGLKLRPKMVRKIQINLFNISPNIDFVYFIFNCNSNFKWNQCVDRRIKLIHPLDLSTISCLSEEEKLFLPFLSNSGDTVFRIGSFVGSVKRMVPLFEINVTKNSPIKLTIAYQSFIETKELKDFKTRFNRFAINEVNENEITQTVFIQTQMI